MAGAQSSPGLHESRTAAQAPSSSGATSSETQPAPSPRADAYYNYSLGHLFELQYESTNDPDYATKAIEAYKKAYALDPKSPVIGERLAEMYWESQRLDEAIAEAQQLLKQEPERSPHPPSSWPHLSSPSG